MPRSVELHGPKTGRVTRTLTGEGRMFGISFRPVMFRALLGRSMSTLTDRVVPLESVLGPSVSQWAQALRRARDLETEIGLTKEFFESRLIAPTQLQLQLRDCVEAMASDRDLLRVEDLCKTSGLDARTLQRRFSDYVGLSPKSVIRRYRMHEAAIRLGDENTPSLAALAASLGYSDQAHFARDFKRTVGETPRAFATFLAKPRPSDRMRSLR
jgi:AraC-like DNA-binding protein